MCDKYVVVVPSCMLAPGLQAVRNRSCEQWRIQCLQLLIKYNVDIIPFSCTESAFCGYEKGLQRKPHGIDYYCALEEYETHCAIYSDVSAEQIAALIKKGYYLVAIMGIEHSPSCAVNYLYSHSGTQKRSGLFMEKLKNKLKQVVSEDVYIGINRRHPKKAIDVLQGRLQAIITAKEEGVTGDDYL